MCLTRTGEVQIAEEDILVYKAFSQTKNGEYYAPYFHPLKGVLHTVHCSVDPGKGYKEPARFFDRHLVVDPAHGPESSRSYYIEAGYGVFKTMEDAKWFALSACRCNNAIGVVLPMLIPKNTRYAEADLQGRECYQTEFLDRKGLE